MENIDSLLSGKRIREGLAFSQLLGEGTCFDLEGAREDFEDNIVDAEEEYALDDLKQEASANPYQNQTFEDIAKDMTEVNKYIKKKILTEGGTSIPEFAEVKVHYSGFFQGQEKSFDSTYLHGAPITFIIGCEAVLPGIQMAVRTMKKGEESHFIIAHNLLFGENGCPPRIPPKADGLFVMKLLDVAVFDQLTEQEEQTDFFRKFSRASALDSMAKEYFNKKSYQQAIFNYEKAVREVEFARLKDGYEERAHQDFLYKMFLNLAVCYNKVSKPKKACTALNKMKEIRSIHSNSKALFHLGCALIELNDFKKARSALERALQINNNNEDILNAIQRLNVKEDKYLEEERNMCLNALNVMSVHEIKQEQTEDPELTKVRQILRDFQDSTVDKIMLPTMFTAKEMSYVRKLGPEYNVQIEAVPTEQSIEYKLVKKPRCNNPFAN